MVRVGAESLTTDAGTSIRLGAATQVSDAEGPGRRFAVWTQGCSIRCPGCFNPHLWTAKGGTTVDPRDLAQQAIESNVEGVTLLGGEPFDQAEALAVFASGVRDAGLSVMTFSGHYLRELNGPGAPRGAAALLAQTDLLIDGPYIASELDHHRPWVGSRNQGFHFLSDRYRHLEPALTELPDRLEIRVDSRGEVRVNGWASVAMLDDLLDGTVPAIGRGQVQ